jgi:hypothetical protein
LDDSSALVVLVEAEKSALALTAAAMRAGRRLLAIGLGGCWSWRGTIGKTTDAGGARVDERGPLPDLDRIGWRERDVVILFDANATTNRNVQAARLALSRELAIRGASVRMAELPMQSGINGPDDYIAKYGDMALFALMDAAKPAVRPTRRQNLEKPAYGRDVLLEDLEPWPEPTDGAALLEETASVIRRHVILSGPQADAAALWTGAAHAIDGLQQMPMLLLSSPPAGVRQDDSRHSHQRSCSPACHGREPDASRVVSTARPASPDAHCRRSRFVVERREIGAPRCLQRRALAQWRHDSTLCR